MDLEISEKEARFRQEARAWLEDNVPKEKRPPDGKEAAAYDRAWQRKLFDGGWAGVAWPKEHGGMGGSLSEQVVWYEECSRAQAPAVGVCFVGINHAGPTLIECGTEEQKAFHLPKILSADAVWCQGFSEPGAGSDLANIRTRGEIDGDHLVVTGQKIWTSNAHHASYQELLVRTEAGSQRHRGISWVIGDVTLPGVDIRPIRTMDGAEHFAEVFYNEVRIPLANVVGTLHDGWRIAMANLGFERATALTAAQIDLARTVEMIVAAAASRPGGRGGSLLDDDDEIRTRIAEARVDVAALRSMSYGMISRLKRHPVPGPEGSMVRLTFTQLVQRVNKLAMDVLGIDTLDADLRSAEGRPWVRDYLLSFKDTISGGTKDIQRNIIAERILALPRGR
jgi:alkylation response protein AidB-like acyl-CoA dehydrogenase